MPKRAKFTPINTSEGWRVNVPAKYSSHGKRERHFYKTRVEAQDATAKFRDQREAFGDQARAIAPGLAEGAVAAEKLLEPFGLSILDAAQMVANMKRAELASRTIEKALAAFQKVKQGRSESQTNAYDQMGKALRAAFPERMLSSITAQELHDHTEAVAGTNSTFNGRARLLRAFWRWCGRVPRSWCDAKLVEVLENRETAKSVIGILKAMQCQDLLTAAEEHYPECVPGFAISLFTGICDAELKRLLPEHITAEGISVPSESAKLGTRRFIEMPPSLAAWLEAYPIGETVLPANWERKEKAVRRHAGWKVWSDLFPKDERTPPDELPEWPHNALRHTHASAAVAMGIPIERLIFEFGHSGGTATLKSHYVGAMSKAEALKIMRIGPKGTTIPVIRDVA